MQAAVREAREESGLEVDVGELLAVGELLSETHDPLFVFRGRATGAARVQEDEVVVEHRWLSPEEADVLMPWHPGGVQALLDGRIGYYGHPSEPLGPGFSAVCSGAGHPGTSPHDALLRSADGRRRR